MSFRLAGMLLLALSVPACSKPPVREPELVLTERGTAFMAMAWYPDSPGRHSSLRPRAEFEGKWVELSGVPEDRGRNRQGWGVLTLAREGNCGAWCYFDDDGEPELWQLDMRRPVTVRGVLSLENERDLRLTQCRVVVSP